MVKSPGLISSRYLKTYSAQCKVKWPALVARLKDKQRFSAEDLEYYILASSIYSSKIEGNTLDADSFFRNRGKKSYPKKKEVQEIEDLADAYSFAAGHKLNKLNFFKAHEILSKQLLAKKQRGKVRKSMIGVRDSRTLRPVYIAVEPEFVNEELVKLFSDMNELVKRELSNKEIFYYASMIHLWCAKIHPFMDGNGRAARLLEKWFLASKLGQFAWSINSEKYYWDNRPAYYKNIALGYNYYSLHWERCLPFLLMLPQSLKDSFPVK